MTTQNEPTIEELCRPISAKVMPRSAMYSLDHTPLSATEALANQRISASGMAKRWMKNRAGQSGERPRPAQGE